MKYTPQEVIQFIQEEDVKFIRLAFCDCFGRPKNISIMPHELERAFKYGIAIDASAIAGFGDEVNSDLFLHPDASTIALLPWRPEHGSVVRMFCSITHPDGTPFAHDTRGILKQAVADAAKAGYAFSFGSELEFYLFRLDENGEVTDVPYDQATYMDVAPEDRCENVRREICLTLERMGIQPESSHHEEGPGQNEVDFKRPFKRVKMSEAIKEYTGFDITGKSEEEIRAFCLSIGLNVDETMGKGKLIDEIFGEKCESHYIQPTFIYDYPVEMSPLTKMHRSDPGLTERFELFVNGKEVANAYSELNDPIDQLNRFKDQLALQERGDDEAMFIDYDFVRALEYGMPPTSGMGIGIDRLCMFLTNSPSIQDVLLFPQMKPEKVATVDADEKFIELGIPADWVAVVRKAGYQTVEALRAVENPNKLHQELSGLNKKMKLGLKTLSPDEVKSWIK